MRTKTGVRLADLEYPMRVVLMKAELIWKAAGRPEGVTVVSTGDGVHGAYSLHPYGFAADLRTSYFTDDQAEAVAEELREELPIGYDIVLHPHVYDVAGVRIVTGHIHVEWDDAKKWAQNYYGIDT